MPLTYPACSAACTSQRGCMPGPRRSRCPCSSGPLGCTSRRTFRALHVGGAARRRRVAASLPAVCEDVVPAGAVRGREGGRGGRSSAAVGHAETAALQGTSMSKQQGGCACTRVCGRRRLQCGLEAGRRRGCVQSRQGHHARKLSTLPAPSTAHLAWQRGMGQQGQQDIFDQPFPALPLMALTIGSL